jgi:hypothetical protein
MISISGREVFRRKKDRPLLRRRIKWPAVMLAVIRKAKVNGRSKILVSSIKVINGASQRGVEEGRKEAKNIFTLFLKKINKGASHSINPSGNVIVGKVVIENVYGINPVRLKKMSRQKVVGIKMSHPVKDFFQGAIWLRIKESSMFVVCV